MANADKQPKAIEEWIQNITKLQKTKAVDTVQYRKYLEYYSFSIEICFSITILGPCQILIV